MRERVAALINRDGQLLFVRQRARGPSGRHDGVLYRTLPGGGVEPGESPAAAVAREVLEEVGLVVSGAAIITLIEDERDRTTLFGVSVEPGEPVLGADPEIQCDCPRLVGLEWVQAPPTDVWHGPDAGSALKAVVTDNDTRP